MLNSTVLAEYSYDAYGNHLSEVENGIDNPIRYAGYYYDDETGNYYLKNRYYNSRYASFLTEDPYWNVNNMLYGNATSSVIRNVYYPAVVSSSNRFIYCLNNPIRYFDFCGLEPTPEEAIEMVDYTYNIHHDIETPELIGGWEYLYHKEIGESGVVGYFSRKKEDGSYEYALVNKGTKIDSGTDWKNNILQPFGASEDMKASIANAETFVRNNPDVEVTFVGHSKGGAEAAANAVATDRNAILFNPATVNLGAYDLNPDTYTADMTAYIVEGDILNIVFGKISTPIDNVQYLPQQYNVSTKNIITNIGNAIKNHQTLAIRAALKDWRNELK